MTSSSDDYVYSLDLHFDPFVHLHQKLSQRSMNRSELQDQLIQQIIDDMDIKTMAALLYDMMDESYDNYSEKELIAEVEEYYPHILEESEEPSEATGWQ